MHYNFSNENPISLCLNLLIKLYIFVNTALLLFFSHMDYEFYLDFYE